jgi:hypothetical protein
MTINVVQTVHSNTPTTTIAATGGGGTNTLIVCIDSFNAATTTISGVTLGGTPLTLAVGKILVSGGNTGSWIYYLPGIAAGQTSVVISGTNVTLTSGNGGVCIYEVAGLLSSPLDKTNPGSGSTTAYSSGSTGTLSQPNEFVVAVANADAPTSPAGFANTAAGTTFIAGFQIVSATTALTYAGTQSAAVPYTAVIASFAGPGNISVALQTAAVAIAAHPVGIAAAVPLACATVAIAAHPVTAGTITTVALACATVAIAAHPVGIGRTVPLHAAAVAVAAHPVTVAIVTPRLIASITAASGTDQFGNPYQAGVTVYGPGGSFAQLTGGILQFQGLSGQATPAYVATDGAAGLLELSSGTVSSGDHPALIDLQSADANGGQAAIDLTSADQVLIDGDLIVNGQAITGLPVPLGYPLSTSATTAQIVNCLNSLISGFITAGVIS